ncbi:protein mono-ADP-ribosyltransferase PARP14-like [Octopus sinensis]|uniref:Poly [ADP-ribose] polymerase n=1 Tax=Octopus sinensis TaxID=2607531 RepID=A0A7E6ESQ3_9MOLL|nr:protein mono-ADP-ribosyltransferase PARP14-like [Octopus sinensis]
MNLTTLAPLRDHGLNCQVSSHSSLQCKNNYLVLLFVPEIALDKQDEFDEYLRNRETKLSSPSFPGPQQKTVSIIPRPYMTSGENAGIKINLMIGSISNVSVDVIVNSTNEHLQLDSGSISKFILNAAGPQIQAECNRKYPQGISTFEIAITEGYNLKCKNVIHLVLPPWDENSSDSILQNLTRMVNSCLANASCLGAESLAFPILGAGVLNYPIEKLPGTMYEAVKESAPKYDIKDVYFVVFPKDTEIVKKFKEYFQQMSADGSAVTSDDEDDEDEEIEDNVSTGQHDDGVTLKFFAKYQNLDNAIETVKKEYLSLLTTEEIPFDTNLTESRKLSLRDISRTHEVHISISNKITIYGRHSLKLSLRNISRTHKIQISISETITIYGRHSHVKDAKISVQSLLMEFKETDEETLLKTMVQWSYYDENFPANQQMFEDKVNAKLEKAYSLQKKFLDWNNRRYDFQKMSFQLRGSDFKMKRKQNLKDELIPNTWSTMENEELIKIVPVKNGPEYDDIKATFDQNLPSCRIIKIERIQNKTLYHGYQALKRKFEVENPNITNEVDGLWHGTAERSVDGINKSGFNRSYCGKNATAYGEGVYFARDIYYSANDTYSTPDHNGIKRIYQCSVLVGRVMLGHHGLKVLHGSYNSAIDNFQRPNIYVTFHDSQAYPNYLITFSNH